MTPERSPWRAALLVLATTVAMACGEPSTQSTDSGTPQPDPAAGADAGADAGEPPPIPGPEITAQESYGAFVPSPTRAVLPGTTVTLIGVQGMVMDPKNLGRPSADGSYDGWINAGLIALDTTSGKVRFYTSADGLPGMEYADPFANYGVHTASIFDLAWIEKDKSFVAAAWNFVVKGVLDGDHWTFSAVRIKAPGQVDYALNAHIAVAGGEIFVGSDQGVAVLDPATLGTKGWVDFGLSLTSNWVSDLSAGVVNGKAAVGVVFGPADLPPAYVALVNAGERTAQLFNFADGAKPLSVHGMQGSMLVGAVGTDGRGLIHGITDTAGTLAMNVVVTADALATSSHGSILPGIMAWDAKRERLVVGGQLTPTSRGGLVELSGTADGNIWGSAEDLIPSFDPYEQLLPWGANVIAFDDDGRLYLTGKQLCSEHKTRQVPLYRLERNDLGEARMVRPYVSGARDIEQDPVNGDTWLALRDAQGGMACDGIPVAQSVCRLRADGACEIIPAVTNDGSLILPAPGTVDIAFGNADQRELAFATLDEATWIRRVDSARQVMTQMDPKISLDLTSAAFGDMGELWLGSQADWQIYPDMDELAINRRSPHGLGLLQLDDQANVTSARRYVRAKSDLTDLVEFGGMPSDTVWAVMPLSKGSALVALGVERSMTSYDHLLGEPAPSNAKGGLALIQGDQVTAFSPPEGQAFSDVVGLVKGKDGAIFAVDSELGVLSVNLEAHTTAVWVKPSWTAPERALSIAADTVGHLAVGTTRALYVYGADTGVSTVFPNAERGYVWRVRFTEDGALLVGTDQGLSRVAIQGATLPATLGPASYAMRDLWLLPPPCGGVDGCACKDISNCADGYDCACDLSGSCTCQMIDPCTKDPGGRNCVCQSGSTTCNSGLYCECSTWGGCSCQVDPTTCQNGACACVQHYDCPTNWYCNGTVGTCAERQACDATCTCATTSGCSPGLVCQSGFTGRSCI